MPQSSIATHLPELRVLPLTHLLPHEHTDPRRATPLVERLRRDGVLRNPPVVAPLDEGRRGYVVLDGANRVAACQALGIPRIVAQVVDYRAVRLEVWHHALSGCDPSALLRAITEVKGIEIGDTDPTTAEALLVRREALLCFTLEDRCRTLRGGHDARAQIALLNQVVQRYQEVATVQRTLAADLGQARAELGDVVALALFPRFEAVEVADLARRGILLPAGITRHILPLRALHINYPLAALHDHQSLDEQQAQLERWVHDCLTFGKLRIYAEPTALFDE
ncbi:MAG: ParB N-terminal domain-containing protein [Thermoflexales bacterium]